MPPRPPGPAKMKGKVIDRCRNLCPGFAGLQTKITLTNTFDNKKSDIPISLPTKWWVSEVLNSKGKAILLNVPNEAYAKILNRILRRRNLNKSSLLEDLDLRQVRCP